MKKSKSSQKTVISTTSKKSFLLSLIIPCYNESKRIELMMAGLADFENKWKGNYEVVIVDDGSKDDTVEKIKAAVEGEYSFLKDKVIVEQLPANEGKGSALKQGVSIANGDYILTLDTDMSTKPTELINWEKKDKDIFSGNDTIYIGSRKHKEGEVEALQSRRFVGGVFNSVVQLFTTLNLKDTQCGFKLYPRSVAKTLFGNMKTKGWAHDVEVLYQADLNGIKIEEMPIYWVNQPESKVNIVKGSISMFFSVLFISLRTWFNNTFVLPFRVPDTMSPEQKKNIQYQAAFNILALLLIIVMPAISFQFAITGDEHWHYDYGNDIFNYFFHGDTNAQTATSGIQYYGGLFDFIVASFHRVFGFWSHYQTMHFLNALVGAVGIIYAGKIGKLLGGWKAAILTLIFLVLSPSWFGHNFANPKDIPFSVGYTAGIYFIFQFVRALPNPRFKQMFGLVCSIGFAMGVRIGGLLLIAYLIFFSGLYALFTQRLKSIITVKFIRQILVISLLGYFIALICWPYAHLDIFSKPLESLKVMSNFFITIGLLYEGKSIMSSQIPWYYIPKYILYTAPVIILIGFVLSLLLGFVKFRNKKQNLLLFSFLLFTLFFPIGYAIYKHSVLYDGWRHFLFIYPPLIIVTSVGLAYLLDMRQKLVKYIVVAVIVIGLILPAKYILEEHPFESLYYNEIAGGLKGIYGQYETDYYMLGTKPATEWLIEHEHLENKEVVIATNCIYPLIEYVKPYKNIIPYYVRYYEHHKKDWDYCVLFSRFSNPSQLQTGNWPPEAETIHTIKVQGVPIAAVLKRKTKKDFEGFQLIEQNKVTEAKGKFLEALKEFPTNTSVWQALADIYESENNSDSAIYAAQQVLKTYPGDISTYQLLGTVYLKNGEVDKAVSLYRDLAKYNEEYSHLFMAYLYANTGDAQKAFGEIDNVLEINPKNQQAYQMGIQMAQQLKDTYRAQGYYDRYLKEFPQSGQQEEN